VNGRQFTPFLHTPMNILVLGLGQSLRSDDAAGLKAVERWRQSFSATAADPRLTVELAELPGLGLLDLLAGASHALIVDAVRSGAAPGTLHFITPDRLENFGPGAVSAHGWGVAETLALAGQLGQPLPDNLVLIGIEAASFDLGAPLSPAVELALGLAAHAIEAQIQRWLS
jgi:hydrogenase maturation protease